MLVLSRKPGEKVLIGGGIAVTVVSVIGNKVRLAFDAPDQVRILRAELAGRRHDLMGSDQPLNPDPEGNPDCSELVDAGVGQGDADVGRRPAS